MLLDFGFSQEKYAKQIERYKATHRTADNIDEIVARWQRKSDAFNQWFIDRECDAVLSILRDIESEFTFGNSIYPSDTLAKVPEFIERRKHINAAISKCYVLKQELQYIIRVLPVDINKFTRFSDAIDKQIELYKGVRQADNRFLRPKAKKDKTDTVVKEVSDITNSILSIMQKFNSI
jgi:DNA-binding Lrp family transcriptional regulator